jgi:hypothetical protein
LNRPIGAEKLSTVVSLKEKNIQGLTSATVEKRFKRAKILLRARVLWFVF